VALLLAGLPAAVQAQATAIVANATRGSIDAVSLASMQVQSSASIASATSPRAIELLPGSTRAYVAGAGAVVVYDTAAQQAVSTIAMASQPYSIVNNADGSLVYVSLPDANAIAVIATATNTVQAAITVGTRPRGVALSRDGRRLYSANNTGRSISVIDTATHSVTRTMALSSIDPNLLAVTADDQFLLVTDATGTNLTVVNLLFGDVFRTIALGAVAQSIAITPDGSRIHVPTTAGVVTIDASTFLTAGTMTDVGAPSAIGFNSSGSVGYITDTSGGRLVAFDPSNLTTLSEAPLAPGISAVALPHPMMPQAGWWWSAGEPGRGYSLEVSGWKILFSAYAYDTAGDAVWYMAYPNTADGVSYTGDIVQYRNGQTLSGTYQAPELARTVGPMSLRFTSPTAGTAAMFGREFPLQRYDIISNGVAAGRGAQMPQTGWWWGPSEWGRGYFVETQSNTLFLAAYMYDAQGDSIWYYAGGTVNTGGLFQSPLSICRNGQPLDDTSTYRQGACTSDQGTVTIQFWDASSATLTFPNGTTVALSRLAF
jgi:YVTN family beta-propeller protein